MPHVQQANRGKITKDDKNALNKLWGNEGEERRDASTTSKSMHYFKALHLFMEELKVPPMYTYYTL